MIHTFTIAEHDDGINTPRYAARCDTCGEKLHKGKGIQIRELVVSDAKQHARIAHAASDVSGNDIAWERVE